MKKIIALMLLLVGLCLYIWTIIPVEQRKYGVTEGNIATDYTGLLPTKIARVEQATSREQLVQLVQQANREGKHIAIAGLQHSQGGHTFYDDAIVIDMRPFNQVLAIDVANKTVKVEAGATFDTIQQAIAPYSLALKVTQSQSIFTVGGSLSINAHGRDIRHGSVASTVEALTLLTPTGEIEVLQKGDDKLRYVLGGYGLFGVMLDVTLAVTADEFYQLQTDQIAASDYETYLANVLANEQIAMHYARLSVAPASFLEEMYTINYYETQGDGPLPALKGEGLVKWQKLALDLARAGGQAEDWFWSLQGRYMKWQNEQVMSRNNVMRSESAFMEFVAPDRVEVLQEFFVPVSQFTSYVEALKAQLPSDDAQNQIKVHNITVRYTPQDEITKLNYATDDMLAFVVLMQHGLTEEELSEAQAFIQRWTDVTLAHGGTYYLPYYPYQTQQQFEAAYKEAPSFAQSKLQLDPNEVFVNHFYINYLQELAHED